MVVPPPHPATDTPPDPAASKSALRRALRARRGAFVAALEPAAHAAALSAIEANLAPMLADEGIVAGYLAQQDEVDLLKALRRAFHLGRTIALPHLTQGSRDMRFTRWSPDATLVPGLLDIPQVDGGDMVEPTILLVPLVGFDRAGTRLGQGGGYYDRWFAAHPSAIRIGVAWNIQEADALPREAWDVPLHGVATEKEWIDCR